MKVWRKWLARIGIVFLEKPDEGWPQDSIKDFVMAFHYCSCCHEYRFDTFFDPLSYSSHFVCGGCGRYGYTSEGIGIFLFRISECIRVSSGKWRWMKFIWYMAFGLGKHLPDDRGGKTAGELEWEATQTIMGILIGGFN